MASHGSSHTRFYSTTSNNEMDIDRDPLDIIGSSSGHVRAKSSASDSDMPPLLDLNPSTNYSFDTNFDWTTAISNSLPATVSIDGRDAQEEEQWWNLDLRNSQARPGPGMTPPLASAQLIDHSHPIFSATYKPSSRPITPAPASPVKSSATSPSIPIPPPFLNPTPSELQHIKPHNEAFYIPTKNYWVLIAAREGPLPIPSDFQNSKDAHPFPDSSRRGTHLNCLTSSPRANHTHHFHLYPDALPGSSVFGAFHYKKNGLSFFEADQLVDVLGCCQCSLYFVRSKPVPGVLPYDSLQKLIEDKLAHPVPGQRPQPSVACALDTLLRYAAMQQTWSIAQFLF
jgi:ubiquitin carboxyl-terminal hydrolase 25